MIYLVVYLLLGYLIFKGSVGWCISNPGEKLFTLFTWPVIVIYLMFK